MTLGDIPSSNERPVSRRRFICRQKAELWVGWACLAGWLDAFIPAPWKRYEQFSRLSPVQPGRMC
jgi:hypothetical protein